MKLSPPLTQSYKSALKITSILKKAGFEVYFAGGAVRDIILGQECEDWDIATSATPADIQRIFRKTVDVGANFGVIVVISGNFSFEVATFRNDENYIDGRHPGKVTFTSAKEDVFRRDFTINGLLLDPDTNELVDYVDGYNDIQRKSVKAIGDPQNRFDEDKLRMLRAVRFAARLDFEIEKNTLDAILKMAPLITVVSKERIKSEIEKIITSKGAERGILMLKDTGLLDIVLKEVGDLSEVEQNPDYHPEGNVLIHTAKMFRFLEYPIDPVLAWSLLLHDTGKKETFKIRNGKITFYSHEKAGSDIAGDVLTRLKASRNLIDDVKSLVRDHMKLVNIKNVREAKFKRLVAKELKSFEPSYEPLYFKLLMEINRVDSLAASGNLSDYEDAEVRLQNLPLGAQSPMPYVNGDDLIKLGLKPGPIFKIILTTIMDAQLEMKFKNRDEALLFAGKLVKERQCR